MTNQTLQEIAQTLGATVRLEGDRPIVATYGDSPAEYDALTQGAGLVDGSRHGRLRLSGADRVAFLHNFTTQDIKGLQADEVTWAVVANWKGTVTDFVEVRAGADALTVITAPGRAAETAAWFNKYVITDDVTIDDETATTAQLELLGPQGAHVLTECGLPVPALGHAAEGDCAGETVTVLRHRWIGGQGFRLLVSAAAGGTLWQALVAAGAKPAGQDALSWRRLQDGFPAYGHELGEDTNPWEARLHGAISLDKGCYLGQEIIARLNAYQKVQRLLVGLTLGAGELAAVGTAVLSPEGEAIGKITSVATPPDSPQPLALALVKRQWAEPGTALQVGDQPATTVDLPFWQ